MDLMNFLKSKVKESTKSSGNGGQFCEIFFECLFTLLEKDIESGKSKLLAQNNPWDAMSPLEQRAVTIMSQLQVVRGDFSNRNLPTSLSLGFIFIQVPEQLGILIEPSDTQGQFVCHRALLPKSSWSTPLGESSVEPRLVIKIPNVLTFVPLDVEICKIGDELVTVQNLVTILFELALL